MYARYRYWIFSLNNVFWKSKLTKMKKLILALMLVTGVLGTSMVHAQDSTKAEHKLRKVAKKANKGKYHKAMKKADKMVKKDDKAK